MGKLLTCLPRLSLAQLRPTLWSTIALCTCRRDLYFPIAPMGICLVDLSSSILIFYDGCCLQIYQYGVRATAPESSKVDIAPMGKLLTCPIDSHLSIRIDIWFYQGSVRACHACKLPIAPMGFSHVLRLCLQGGGVNIYRGTVRTVSFSLCTITGNTALNVRAHAQNFPSP